MSAEAEEPELVRSVAVLGLGTMGSGMADRLIDAGLDVTVWNRSPERARPFAGKANVAPTAADAVAGADAVLTMLFDAAAVREVMASALPAMSASEMSASEMGASEMGASEMGTGAIWMQSSTVGARAAADFARQADRAGVRYVDAPMLGTKQPARDGNLTALLAGDDGAVAALAPVIDAVASRTVRAGEKPPAASALKIAVNTWIATITAGIGQSLTIAERLGVDPRLVLTALDGTGPDSPYAQTKGNAILNRAFDPQFAVAGLLKDVRLARDETPGVARSLLDALDELYSDAADAGAGGEDIAAVWRAFQR
ncbi:MAG: NAD(P)-dependent oxidoreductase [Pseudoclavibacter sp.]